MNANVLRRFITIAFVATLVMMTAYYFYDAVVDRPRGDYEAEKGDMHLSSGEFDKALSWFNAALRRDPEHLGALMGRSAVFISRGEHAPWHPATAPFHRCARSSLPDGHMILLPPTPP